MERDARPKFLSFHTTIKRIKSKQLYEETEQGHRKRNINSVAHLIAPRSSPCSTLKMPFLYIE